MQFFVLLLSANVHTLYFVFLFVKAIVETSKSLSPPTITKKPSLRGFRSESEPITPKLAKLKSKPKKKSVIAEPIPELWKAAEFQAQSGRRVLLTANAAMDPPFNINQDSDDSQSLVSMYNLLEIQIFPMSVNVTYETAKKIVDYFISDTASNKKKKTLFLKNFVKEG